MLSTVIINSHTDAWLGDCVDSVWKSDEVVIINDAMRSQAQYPHVYSLILNAFPIGIAQCKQMGKNVARGDQVMCVRGSDVVDPAFMEKCQNSDFDGIIYGNYISPDRKEITTPEEVNYQSVLQGYVPSTYCFPRAADVQFGSKEPYEDVEFWLHALDAGIRFMKLKMVSYYDRLGLEEIKSIYDDRLRILRQRYLGDD
jgi:hypothetical protein